MGILEFFGVLKKHGAMMSAIKSNWKDKMHVDHLMLDLNSLIHTCSQSILHDINSLFGTIVENIINNRSINGGDLVGRMDKYKLAQHFSKGKPDLRKCVSIFHDTFTDDHIDILVITDLINTILKIINTYCDNDIKTLYIAIDGIPSKAKMVEQKQRRYLDSLIEFFKGRIFDKHGETLMTEAPHIYVTTRSGIKWIRSSKITPGTGFMDLLSEYLHSDQVQTAIKKQRNSLSVVVSDVHEVGEGEKKIVNYIKNHVRSGDSVLIYSPDGDMIPLTTILKKPFIHILRQDNDGLYNLVNIDVLKDNICSYISSASKLESLDCDRVNDDIAYVCTFFGNDFVPKIETVSVRKGFQSIMDSYSMMLQSRKKYIIKKIDGIYTINIKSFRALLKLLLVEEMEYIANNAMYNKYINAAQIKYAFGNRNVNIENIVSIYRDFMTMYNDLKSSMKQTNTLDHFINNEEFMTTLRKSVVLVVDDQPVNAMSLDDRELMDSIKKYYDATNQLPRLSINLNTYSGSIKDQFHASKIKSMKTDYEIEMYSFDKLLDDYKKKFNAYSIVLDKNRPADYYHTYFDDVRDPDVISSDYIEGIMWVFNYYYNDERYINTWYYKHERAPLLMDIYKHIRKLSQDALNGIMINLDRFSVKGDDLYFNAIEQYIYVTPMTKQKLDTLPDEYREHVINGKSTLRKVHIDIESVASAVWNSETSSMVDCRGIPFLSKCFVKEIKRLTSDDDQEYIQYMRTLNTSTKK